MSAFEVAKSKIESFRQELVDYPELTEEFEQMAMEAHLLIYSGDENGLITKPWYAATSLVSMFQASTKKKREKIESLCPHCKTVRLTKGEERYTCPQCGYTEPLYKPRAGSARVKNSGDRTEEEVLEHIRCIAGIEELPQKVKDQRDTIEDYLIARGYSPSHIPDMITMREAFAHANLKTLYKHCTAMRRLVFHYAPKPLEQEDVERIMEIARIIIAGHIRLREDAKLKNIRYVPAIVKWIIYKLKMQKKYAEFLSCIVPRKPRTEVNMFATLENIYSGRSGS